MAKNPYRYFRIEARELVEGMSQAVLEIEKGAVTPELVSRLLRLAHTLKGAARVVKQIRISELSHALEDVMAPFQKGHSQVPKDRINAMLGMLDNISADLALLDDEGFKQPVPAKAAEVIPETYETVRIDVEEMDHLLDNISEIGIQLSSIKRHLADLDTVRKNTQTLSNAALQTSAVESEKFSNLTLNRSEVLAAEIEESLGRIRTNLALDLERISTDLTQVRDAANQLRLLPASILFSSLERTARDTAQSLQKQVQFETSGGELRLDAHVLTALRDILQHVARNAVAHGIEQSAQRVAAGKSAKGAIRLSVERKNNRIHFTCQDDGTGVNLAAVRQAIVKRGIKSTAEVERMGQDQLLHLLLSGGITTSREVTEVSGRGVGLDAVRATVTQLKGDLSIRTEAGKGTTVEISVPVSLASLTVLRFETSGIVAALPLDAVIKTARVQEKNLARSNEGVALLHEGQPIPTLTASNLLCGKSTEAGFAGSHSAILIKSSTGMAALGVERLLGTSTIVVRSLPTALPVREYVVGAALDIEGHAELVLEPGILVQMAQSNKEVLSSSISTLKPLVLVIDDSLTTRMLEQSILEAAGYRVEVAVSAEEGLEKAKVKKYDLFIVDVEMPGMNGFEFVEFTRKDPLFRDIPAILVTSLGSPENRQRGRQVGACAYIVKSEFDQERLLQIIRNTVG